VPEIRRLLEIVLPKITWSPENVIAWFMKQQKNKEKSKLSHKRKWLKDHPS
jgi:ABC-type proline/glycine betaine transport system substrate-binding protein